MCDSAEEILSHSYDPEFVISATEGQTTKSDSGIRIFH